MDLQCISPPLKCIGNVSKRIGNSLQRIFNVFKMHYNEKTLQRLLLPNRITYLVLSRAALFDLVEERIKSMTIYLRHLGISWTYKRWRNKVQSSTGRLWTWKIKWSKQRRMLQQRIQPAGHERTIQRYQVAFRRDFSDPQGGKGSFD